MHFQGYDTIYSLFVTLQPRDSKAVELSPTVGTQKSDETAANISCLYSNDRELWIEVLEWSVLIVSPRIRSVLVK